MFILLFIDLNDLFLDMQKPEYKGLIIILMIEKLIKQELKFLCYFPLCEFSKNNEFIDSDKPATK